MRYLMLVLLVLSGCEDHSQPVLQPTKREFFENGRRSLERTTFSDTPRTVTIKPPNVAQYTRDADSVIVERWLRARGFIVKKGKAQDESAITAVMVST